MSQSSVDCKEIAKSIRGQKPPYYCPSCLKEYKSLTGILYHIGQFGPATNVPRCVLGEDSPHSSPRSQPQSTPAQSHPASPSAGTVRRRPRRELTWGEAQRLVEVEFDHNYRRIEIDNELDISLHSDEEKSPSPEEVVGTSSRRGGGPRTPLKKGRGASKGTSKDTPSRGKLTSSVKNKVKRRSKLKSGKGEGNILLPKAELAMIESLDFPDAPPRESSYYRFVEQSAEDLDETIEYDMDEEDYQWLSLINEERKSQGFTSVPQEVFEILLDRLEKECIFESQMFGGGADSGGKNIYNIDENADCCICNDGDCHNTNAILFCDMCNLAVHQECYGVPYIPEGQWLCRRCIESPSRGVDCALCPNKGGGFKRTVDGRWAHVICAIWIPEVQFCNPVFLEPIDGIKEIPAARWKLTCYICRKRMGACIQCAKPNCYMAFHVTCAQQAGLHMKMEAIKGGEVRKTAFCDSHTPPSVKRKMEKAAREKEKNALLEAGKGEDDRMSTDGKKEESQNGESEEAEKMEGADGDSDDGLQPRTVSSGVKKARQMMEEKKGSCNLPVVNIPYVPQHRLDSIVSRVSLHKKSQFIPKLVSYWKLKRQSRNGVPLLRRLQANKGQRATTANLTEEEREVLAEQLTLWKSLRHDLERARLLIELIRKREKLKREQLRLMQTVNELRLRPLSSIMRRMLDRIARKDPADIFADAVSVEEVPDYLDIIKRPMDFNTMRKKVENNQYGSLDDFEKDFRLVWHNATIYNQKDTIYYKAAIRIKEAGQKILEQAREQVASAAISSRTGLHDPPVEEPPPPTPSSIAANNLPMDFLENVTDESMLETFRERRPSTNSQVSLDEQIDFLQEKLQMIQSQSGYARKRKEKSLRRELTALRRQIRNERKISETDEQVPGGSPRRHRAPSIPRNAEELASHLLHGSLRMTPSRQQILSYSGIRLEERASAFQREQQEAKEKEAMMRGRGRLHSSSDSMLLKSAASSRLFQRVSSEPAPETDGRESEGSDSSSSTDSDQSSDEEEDEEVLVKKPGSLSRREQDINNSLSLPEGYLEPRGRRRPAGGVFRREKAQQNLNQRSAGDDAVQSPHRGRTSKGTAPKRMNPCQSERLRRRLRSMDTLSSDSAAEEDDDEMNGVDDSGDDVFPAHPHRPRKAGRLVRHSRSISLSSNNEEPTASRSPVKAFVVNAAKGNRSSCFSDSEVKDFEANPGVPSASSNEDLSVSGAQLLKSGGRDWGKKLGLKRNLSVSSLEDGTSRKRARDESDSSDGTGLVGVSNGMMMNGGQDIKPMELVWAKCRGYPPYPALVIDPKIPPEGISVQGEKIKAPSDEVLELKSKNPSATYLVRFFDGRRTWQWLPPEKLEFLGVNSKCDDAKIAMAGSSKRSVKEAYTRAKQWLRRRNKHHSSSQASDTEDNTEESASMNYGSEVAAAGTAEGV